MKASHFADKNSRIAAYAAPARQDYLVFSLDGREYAVVLDKVQELCNFTAVNQVAGAPSIIAGAINLRNRNVPVVNLYRAFAPDAPDNGRLGDVIILRSGERVSGVAVDSVIDVITLLPGQVASASNEDTVSLAVVGKRTIVILEADKLMSDFDPGPVERLAA